jgi:DNA (cytosine-5)-methyltransferase 1
MNYYNEHDPKAAAWLTELIRSGVVPAGHVDVRDIQDVKPADLAGYCQCHFFAGIGGWAEALRIAGWPANEPVWTGSCPCQPFSVAGGGKGFADPRHLWPVFAGLIKACQPPIVFGEQVASKAGKVWLAGVFADLEAMGYQRAGADLCAAGVGAPHIRQRLFWMAHSHSWRYVTSDTRPDQWTVSSRNGEYRRLVNMQQSGLEGFAWDGHDRNQPRRVGQEAAGPTPACGAAGFWDESIAIHCRDGKARRIAVEPEFFPLAYGLPGRVGLLRGYGNAIVPPLAAEFIQSSIEATIINHVTTNPVP